MELNTSSHRYGLKDLQPSRSILKLYRDLGKRIITIGSDSHKPEHLGADLDSDMEELKALGYREFCTIYHMKPIYLRSDFYCSEIPGFRDFFVSAFFHKFLQPGLQKLNVCLFFHLPA